MTLRFWMGCAALVSLVGAAPSEHRCVAEPFDGARCTSGPVQVVLIRPGFYEGVTTSPRGDVYTSDQATTQVLRVTPEGRVEVVSKLYDPPTNDGMFSGTLGLTYAPDGTLWIISYDFWGDSRHHGIWTVSRDGSARLAVTMDVQVAPFPNGLVFDAWGNLYVTESVTGTIWRIARGERVARPWLQHPLLMPADPPLYGFGANGIAFKHGDLDVANTDQGTVVRVPVDAGGGPGTPTIFASGLDAPDGVTLGPWKDLYVPFALAGQLVRIGEDGTWRVVAETGLPLTTSVAFGAGRERSTAYIVNVNNDVSTWDNVPMMVKVDVCER
jgi:sugar lactone lactonase YvrE